MAAKTISNISCVDACQQQLNGIAGDGQNQFEHQ